MTVVSMLQDPRRIGGTATAVRFYQEWMDVNRPNERRELYIDEHATPSGMQLARWHGEATIPRFLPELQVPPYLGARRVVRRWERAFDEIHIVGASSLHGWAVTGMGPSLVWLATTLDDERAPDVLRRRSRSRRVAYRAAHPVLRRLEARVFQDATQVVAMSEHTASVLMRLGIDASKVSVTHVPVDTDVFTPPIGDVERRGAIFVGRASDPRKGFDRVVMALRSSELLRARGVLVVSPSPPWESAEGLSWIGPTDDLPAKYQTSELLVLPSRQEGLGIVALEAMACATPVIARSCGGIDQILMASGGGIVVNTQAEFEEAVNRLLIDPDMARAIGDAGRRWVKIHASKSKHLADTNLFRL